jgi:glucan phosphorylase
MLPEQLIFHMKLKSITVNIRFSQFVRNMQYTFHQIVPHAFEIFVFRYITREFNQIKLSISYGQVL